MFELGCGSVNFSIEFRSREPAYRQIADQVKHAIARGVLIPGDKLPTIRELAASLRVNRNTVSRAYQELESEGIVILRPGIGSVIFEGVSDVQLKQRLRILEQKALDLAVQGFHFQIDANRIKAILDKVLSKLEKGAGK